MNIFACKKISFKFRKIISFKFKKISLKQAKPNITQTIGCQELLVKDFKIYAALCFETSKTQYVHCTAYINTT